MPNRETIERNAIDKIANEYKKFTGNNITHKQAKERVVKAILKGERTNGKF